MKDIEGNDDSAQPEISFDRDLYGTAASQRPRREGAQQTRYTEPIFDALTSNEDGSSDPSRSELVNPTEGGVCDKEPAPQHSLKRSERALGEDTLSQPPVKKPRTTRAEQIPKLTRQLRQRKSNATTNTPVKPPPIPTARKAPAKSAKKAATKFRNREKPSKHSVVTQSSTRDSEPADVIMSDSISEEPTTAVLKSVRATKWIAQETSKTNIVPTNTEFDQVVPLISHSAPIIVSTTTLRRDFS